MRYKPLPLSPLQGAASERPALAPEKRTNYSNYVAKNALTVSSNAAALPTLHGLLKRIILRLLLLLLLLLFLFLILILLLLLRSRRMN